MAVAFEQLQQLTENDLFVNFTDSQGNPYSPYYVCYTFYGFSNTRGIWKVGLGERIPAQTSEGKYYVDEKIPSSMTFGNYYVEWVVQKTSNSPLEIVGKKYFGVISY